MGTTTPILSSPLASLLGESPIAMLLLTQLPPSPMRLDRSPPALPQTLVPEPSLAPLTLPAIRSSSSSLTDPQKPPTPTETLLRLAPTLLEVSRPALPHEQESNLSHELLAQTSNCWNLSLGSSQKLYDNFV